MNNSDVTDPSDYIRQRIADAEPRLRWQPGEGARKAQWQAELRAKVAELLGGLPWERCPLNARVIETVDFPGYRRESVLIDTRDGLTAFGYFLTPLPGCGDRKPTVICLHGHTYGVDAISGIDEDGSLIADDDPEAGRHYALQCVKRGYPTFALEQLSFSRRADRVARDSGRRGWSCSRDAMAALMLGETMIGWRVWDAMRAVDYVQSRPEVEPRRIAIMGLSGGGTTALFTACVDTRITTVVVSGYYNTYADSILAMDHCVDNYIPGMLQVAEMPDLAGLIAPRPLFVEGGALDPIYPVHGFRKASDRGKQIFEAFGVPENFGSEIFEGDHYFHGAKAFEFLRQWL